MLYSSTVAFTTLADYTDLTIGQILGVAPPSMRDGMPKHKMPTDAFQMNVNFIFQRTVLLGISHGG